MSVKQQDAETARAVCAEGVALHILRTSVRGLVVLSPPGGTQRCDVTNRTDSWVKCSDSLCLKNSFKKFKEIKFDTLGEGASDFNWQIQFQFHLHFERK